MAQSYVYIRDFINEEEEEYLLDRMDNTPKPKWDYLSNRRLQNWGGLIVKKKGLIPSNDIPLWLQIYIDKVFALGHFPPSNKPNHVLINEYLPGQGIMPHEDGPIFFPVVSTINIGSHTLLDFYRKMNNTSQDLQSRYCGSLLLEPRSLIILTDTLYKDCLHGIAERTEDEITENVMNLAQIPKLKVGDKLRRTARYSFTIRNVMKVAKFDLNSLVMKP